MGHLQNRFNSLLRTREFLERLTYGLDLPAWVKNEATALLVHYPHAALVHDLAAREELVIRQFPRLGRSRVLIPDADSAYRDDASFDS